MNYIAVDCHSSTLEFAVLNEAGHLIRQQTVTTGVKEFLEFVKSVRTPKKIFIEEGLLAGWLAELCIDYGEELIITDPKINKWISKSDRKCDHLDARKLAHLARGGYVKEIYHPIGQARRFRELVYFYHDTVKSSVRLKNKIKAKFRENGISCSGRKVYLIKHRDDWRKRLPKDRVAHFILEGLWEQLDKTIEVKERIINKIRIKARRYKEIKRFKKVPGIDLVHSVTIYAVIQNPHRFSSKKKLWMYAGLAIVEKSSGDKVYRQKLATNYNRLLKKTFKASAEAAIRSKDNPFRKKYLKLVYIDGILPHRAKLTISRNIASTVYGMWKRGEEYDPSIMDRHLQKEEGIESLTGKNSFNLLRK